jgi:hypothetical protein
VDAVGANERGLDAAVGSFEHFAAVPGLS